MYHYLDSYLETATSHQEQYEPLQNANAISESVAIRGSGCQQHHLLNDRKVYHDTTTMGQTTTATTTGTTTTTTKETADARMKETAATLITVASAEKLQADRTVLLGNYNGNNIGTSPQQQQQQQVLKAYSVVMTTIGLGIDPFFGSNNTKDATVAAVKAVRDAMERGVLRFPTDHTNLYLHIKLGVPPATTTTTTTTIAADAKPMHVDVSHLTPLLPSFIPLLPVEVVVGGLLVSNPNPGSTVLPASSSSTAATTAAPPPPGAACTAVACITLQRSITTATPSSPCTTMITTTTGDDVLLHQQATAAANAAAAAAAAATSASATNTMTCSGMSSPTSVAAATTTTNTGGGGNSAEFSPLGPPTTWAQVIAEDNSAAAAPPPVPAHTADAHPNGTVQLVRRSTSIDMLARVSAELQEAQQQEEGIAAATTTNNNNNAAVISAATAAAINNYNYKKLPPGKTPKNNKRLFVKHSYRDFSQEMPLSGEADLLVPNAPQRTPNAAFPLKLHETLSQIESEGYQHIIGWLPHGRSFKIHQQKEFVEMILPKYFVMRKKSSFLRQLNLYGFNRLSGVGPDQGSYYHEKFLRGMKFLCRRIHRQKVNGNGIRAAGNPDAEPNLAQYPICPAVPQTHPLLAGATTVTTTTSPATNKLLLMQAAAATAAATEAAPPSPKEYKPSRKIRKVEALATTTAPKTNGDSCNTRPSQLSPILISTAALTPNLFSTAAPLEGLPINGSHQNSGSTSSPHPNFPLKLHRILDKLEADGETDVISWLSHGRAFLVRDVDRFVHELMPRYFNQTKYSSFQRQLHMYHFQRITRGRDKGAYHHPSFQRGRQELCNSMQRTRVNGKGTRRPGNAALEPDFYVMSPVPIIPRGTFVEIPHEIPALHAEDDNGDD